jgi:hypothetical protein
LPKKSQIPFVSEVMRLLHRSLKDDPAVLTDMKKAAKVSRVELCR